MASFPTYDKLPIACQLILKEGVGCTCIDIMLLKPCKPCTTLAWSIDLACLQSCVGILIDSWWEEGGHAGYNITPNPSFHLQECWPTKLCWYSSVYVASLYLTLFTTEAIQVQDSSNTIAFQQPVLFSGYAWYFSRSSVRFFSGFAWYFSRSEVLLFLGSALCLILLCSEARGSVFVKLDYITCTAPCRFLVW